MTHITSVRLGFATNSSSMHSIILAKDAKGLPDESTYDGEFGWGNFLLSTREEKEEYMATQLLHILGGVHGEDSYAKKKEVAKLTGWVPGDYVDHESVIGAPFTYGRKGYSLECFLDYARYVVNNDELVVRGGNDNDDNREDRPTFWDGKRDLAPWGPFSVVRRDGDNWVSFNGRDGQKIRWNYTGAPYTHSSKPELVDLKITDYCPYGCKFCYQGSTKDGGHADLGYLKAIIDQLVANEVFEVAIGGGEPTQHPDFAAILEYCHTRGLTPNFTTFNLDWARDHEYTEKLLKNVGGFAVSSLSAKTLAQIKTHVTDRVGCRPTIQIPCGAYTRTVVERALNFAAECPVDATLLGYKAVGRGKTFNPREYDWLFKACTDLSEKRPWMRIGADTLFVEQFRQQIKDYGIDDRLVVGREGMFSCYIDAVAGKIAAHSYMDSDKMENLDMADPFKNFPYREVPV